MGRERRPARVDRLGRHRGPAFAGQSDRARFPEYRVWEAMKRRCENPRDVSYAYYGGRGIRVCDAWRDDFAAFLRDVGRRPSARHSIDRYPDTNGNYEPGNCRWATAVEQGRNTRWNRLVTWRGETLPISAWAERLGMRPSTIYHRISELGQDPEHALARPSQKPRRRTRVRTLTLNGETLPLRTWAARTGILPKTLHHRLDAGWSDERALTTPVDTRKGWNRRAA